eukprot:5607887-Alexandrium_andersonii.AAC.1
MARPSPQVQLRDQMTPEWDINPFRAVNPNMCRPLALPATEGTVRNVIAEVEDAERVWKGACPIHP